MTPNMEFPNLSLIRQGVDYRFNVRLRGMSLSMRPLSISEEDQITEEVLDELEKLPEHKRTSLRQSALLTIKKLERGQTSDVGVNDAKMFAAELSRLTPDELGSMMKQYVTGCERLNPALEEMKTEEVQKWVDTLKKNSQDSEMILTGSSFYQLVAICQHLLTQEGSREDS